MLYTLLPVTVTSLPIIVYTITTSLPLAFVLLKLLNIDNATNTPTDFSSSISSYSDFSPGRLLLGEHHCRKHTTAVRYGNLVENPIT